MQPWVNTYLPHKGFHTLFLLLIVVMTGLALKGLFMFLQEVLVADVMQLTLFDIRNHFFRRTLALDLSSFSDQGTSELISRFTNDMDSVSQGLNTLFSKVMHCEAVADHLLLEHRDLAQLAVDRPCVDPRADLGDDGQPPRPARS